MSTEKKTSVVSGFYKLPIEKRREFVTHFANLSEDEAKIFSSYLDLTTADIPYHRIIKILYDDKTIFDRWKFDSKDKQL